MPHAKTLSEAGMALASAGAGERPLGIVDDSHDGTQVLLHANRNGQSTARVLSARQLTSSPPIGNYANLPLLASVDKNQDLRDVVTRTILQTQIYVDLLQDSQLGDPMALAKAFRDMLSEMNEHSPDISVLPEVASSYSAFSEEINMLKILWERYCQDRQYASQEHLHALARNIGAPVAYVHWNEQIPYLLQSFLDTVAQNSPVSQLRIELDNTAAELDRLWAKDSAASNIVPPPMACAAASMEQAAEAALGLIGKWQSQGMQKIGVIGYDRQLVRRMHSMCLHRGVVTTDRAGWLANNLLVGDVLLALVDPELEKSARLRLLQLLARQQKSEFDWAMQAKAALDTDQLGNPMASLQKNWKNPGKRQALGTWFGKLADLTEKSPLAEFYFNDIAADRLKTLLHLLANGYAASESGKDAAVSVVEMRSLLHDVLSSTHLIASTAKSDIQLVSPFRFSSDRFEAVLLLGAHADTLPQSQPDSLFNDEVREALGLPTHEMRTNKMRIATANLVASHEHVAAVWHGARRASPYIELLEPIYVLPPTAAWRAKDAGSKAVASHDVSAAKEIMPTRISASDLDTLMSCPYMFYARKVLRLRENDEYGLYQARDFGTFVHGVLDTFHSEWNDKTDNREALLAATDKYLQENVTDSANLRLYHWLWLSYVEAYAQKMDELRDKGFSIESCEKKIKHEYDINGSSVTFSGMYDRLDRDSDGKLAVIDVKTGNIHGKDIAAGELPQLSVYVCLTESEPRYAAIWQLKSENGENKVVAVEPANDKKYTYDPQGIFDHVKGLIGDIQNGKAMPANGARETCATCAMSGICRRPFWKHSKHDGVT